MNGTINMEVSRQWATRPADQRYLNLDDLYAHTLLRSDRSAEKVAETGSLRAECTARGDLVLGGEDGTFEFTHWSFGQLAGFAKAPAGYLRSLPEDLAAECLNHGIGRVESDAVKLYCYSNGGRELRAVTSPVYGRIHDHEVVDAVRRLNERDNNRWKVPGVLDWATGRHNADTEVTRENTTLYASDRDVWMFLCDDLNPIEVGKLEDGSPDLMFRGFYVWNSEVGSKTVGLATMYMRAVCQNRILWGVEDFKEVRIPHFKSAPTRFLYEIRPALNQFAEGSTGRLLAGVTAAKSALLPDDPDEKVVWLMQHARLTRGRAIGALNAVRAEERREPLNVWDAAQGITALARRVAHQDERVAMEQAARILLDKVA